MLARRVVFVTGGTLTSRDEAFLGAVANPRLHKPVSLGEFRAALDGVIARGPAATGYGVTVPE